MKKFNYLVLPAVLFSFVLLGQGCASDQEEQPESMQDTSSVQEQMEDDIQEAAKNGEEDKQKVEPEASELSLTAEAKDKGAVYFEWETSENINPKRFVIVRDEEANPVHNGDNYWFRQPGSRRSVTWTNIEPSGNYHFRICVLEDEKCAQYSNDVQVEVK